MSWRLRAAPSATQDRCRVGTNTEGLSTIPVPLPPLSLQREFAARVAEARTLQDRQARSRSRLEAGFQALLHRAFRGEF
jgi:type I restriction enzyme, S subunit